MVLRPPSAALPRPKLLGARIMADSDNSTTLPSVTTSRRDRQTASEPGHLEDTDPAILLMRGWLRAEHVSHVLCRLQQRLERRVLDAADPEGIDEKVGYSIACQAEVEATTAALKLRTNSPTYKRGRFLASSPSSKSSLARIATSTIQQTSPGRILLRCLMI